MLVGCGIEPLLVLVGCLICLPGPLVQLILVGLVTICLLLDHGLMRVAIVLIDLGYTILKGLYLLSVVTLQLVNGIVVCLTCSCLLVLHLFDEPLELLVFLNQSLLLDSMSIRVSNDLRFNGPHLDLPLASLMLALLEHCLLV